MAIRYTPDELKYLRDSPLVVKPPGLPPAEQWMGAPADSTHQANRRPVAERHISRNSANPEDIILGPPKTNFTSATSMRSASKPFESTDRPSLRDPESRFNFRGGRAGDVDGDRARNNTLRVRRGEGEQDSDGWTAVKPRKSFGNEGAERFNGRMGLHKEDRRVKDKEDREPRDRPQRGFDTYTRDKDGDHDQERDRDNRKNGTGRGRNEPSWFKEKENTDAPPAPKDRNSNGDRLVDRSRGWREKEREDRGDRGGERGNERGHDRGERRWDKDQRQEREPEWLAEAEEERNQAHTQEDFQRWKDQMQGKDKATTSKTPAAEPPMNTNTGGGFFEIQKPKVETPLAINLGPDKFFHKFTPTQELSPDTGTEPKESAPKAKTTGKASRFTSFFTPQEEPPRRQTEPPPAAMPPPPPTGGLESLFQTSNPQSNEKEAFQALLRKLHQGNDSTPPLNIAMQPKPPAPEKQHSVPISSPEPFQQYRSDRHEERPSTRNSQQALQDLLNNRQVAGSQPTIRPEQMLQELVGQRQNAISQSSIRPDGPVSRNSNSEFLMGLMQSAKAAPDPQRSESLLLRSAPQQKPMDRQMDRQLQQQQQQQMMEQEMQREAAQREAAQRERSTSQRQARPPPPPGFYEDPAVFQRGPPPQHERQSGNPPQPTQILQRPPPPPGLELGWDRAAQLPPPQHRMNQNIPPPPGLAGGPSRAMPPQMFAPGFMGNFPPDMLPGPPRNMQMQPPPGFYNGGGPPPGFMPPGISGFQGPEGLAFGGPFDGRGPPQQGGYRRQ
ncbi:hypothetical protein LSUE1_G001902 [Lachnellula suecica]|uniref:Uncharacterized protein n=1 Tax=Lachnellula suecica TaxID=602035 RepID=A0A8T9CDD6_9HELO|nr:hypothetical protein LSUE1_G001902 [Lachnellula suecica]